MESKQQPNYTGAVWVDPFRDHHALIDQSIMTKHSDMVRVASNDAQCYQQAYSTLSGL
jgi:hypothetical protein